MPAQAIALGGGWRLVHKKRSMSRHQRTLPPLRQCHPQRRCGPTFCCAPSLWRHEVRTPRFCKTILGDMCPQVKHRFLLTIGYTMVPTGGTPQTRIHRTPIPWFLLGLNSRITRFTQGYAASLECERQFFFRLVLGSIHKVTITSQLICSSLQAIHLQNVILNTNELSSLCGEVHSMDLNANECLHLRFVFLRFLRFLLPDCKCLGVLAVQIGLGILHVGLPLTRRHVYIRSVLGSILKVTTGASFSNLRFWFKEHELVTKSLLKQVQFLIILI